MMIYRTAAAVGLGLEMVSQSMGHGGLLPLAGGHLQQLGLVFGVAFLIVEAKEILVDLVHKIRRGRRKRTPRPAGVVKG